MKTYIYSYIETGETHFINFKAHNMNEALDIALATGYKLEGISKKPPEIKKKDLKAKYAQYGKASYWKVLFKNVGDIPVDEEFIFQGQKVRMLEMEHNGENWIVTLLIL